MTTAPTDVDDGMDLRAELGRILTAHRSTLGLSRRALAERHGLAGNTLREVELGLGNPTLARIESLAREVYGITLTITPTSGPLGAAAASAVRMPRTH